MKQRYSLIGIFLSVIFITAAQALTNQELFENKNILILGGTGYLGRAITEELLKYSPRQITIFSRDEVKHFYCSQHHRNNPIIKHVIGDIRDYTAIFNVTRHIDIVFHVAALKRMDALEWNVEEAVKTNIMASMNVFNACVENKVKKVLFISTDKACCPINTYGACKFVSEKIFTNYDTTKIETKFMATRFGNILESTGSVIPIFTDKIKKGEDIPLTDDRMTRFIIDKKEAVELIFNALRYGVGGEIFVRHTSALKITDLIEILKEKFNGHNAIKLIGLRPGEKIHEVLINESEMGRTYSFENYYVITPSLTNWHANHADALPVYIQRGNKINAKITHEYSSDKEVLCKQELEALFKKLGLL